MEKPKASQRGYGAGLAMAAWSKVKHQFCIFGDIFLKRSVVFGSRVPSHGLPWGPEGPLGPDVGFGPSRTSNHCPYEGALVALGPPAGGGL